MDAESIREMFAAFRPVTVRRMFGGAGIYADGAMFAIVANEVIYLKVSTESVEAFRQEGMQPFEYATSSGRRALMSYWRMPDRLCDDPEELARWAQYALEAAQRLRLPVVKGNRGKRRRNRNG